MTTLRKLASVQKILSVEKHPNADTLDIVKVLGWVCVAKAGEFKPGDLCVYVEVDSVLPDNRPEYEFLRDKKFRIKTVRLRGQISQGICFHPSVISDTWFDHYEEGDDVTDVIGVVKYEPALPANMGGEIKGNFPCWIPKTDETRIQAEPWLLEKYADEWMVATEKLDGSSITVYLNQGEFGVCSRNFEVKKPEEAVWDNAYWRLAHTAELEAKLRKYGKNIAIQGELLGPGVQKNKYGFKQLVAVWFNIYDIDAGKYYDFGDFQHAVAVDLGIPWVPVVASGKLKDMGTTVDQLVELAKRESKMASVLAEGIVIRPVVEIRDDKFGRVSFKAINPEYLLKHGE